MRYWQRATAGPVRSASVGLAISVVSFWLLARAIDRESFVEALRQTEPALVAVAVGCLFLSLAAKVARWRALLPRGAGVSFGGLFAILHVGMLINNVLPLRVGDVTRVALTARRPGLRVGHVVSSMVAERAADGVTLLVCFVAVAPFVAGGSSFQGGSFGPQLRLAAVALAVVAALGVLATVTVVATGVRRRLRLGRSLPAGVAALAGSWERITARDGWRIWGWSAGAWLGAFAINYALFRAMGLEVSPLLAVVVTCTTNLAMLVPSSPGHIGVYHAAATVTLVAAGVGTSQAASFGVVSHLVNVVPVSLVGAGFLASMMVRGQGPRAVLEGAEGGELEAAIAVDAGEVETPTG